MRRTYFLALVALAIVVFVAVSALLARAFSADAAERSAITALVQAEAQGNLTSAVADIQGCAGVPSCEARLAANVAALRRAGAVSILQIQPSTGFSLTGTLGTARVAWKVGSSLPIVQCVRVRRAGNVISGLRIELLAITPRITSDASCPTRF